MKKTFVEWEDKYKIGIKEVDEQHMGLVKIINDLYDGLSSGRVDRTTTFKSAAKKVVEYVKNHFTTEEKYMIQYGYSELENQKKRHKEFINKLLSSVKSYEQGKSLAPSQFLFFLKDWWLNHVGIEDKKFGQFLQE